ncbi:hypothetical protein EOD41_09470 [Mucilaginibacter limnophilus]|uniref:Uncharacterized protein n=1 Tax=Mucilaginibacter limnophilus TaxID=1932778 RepID=A0A3S2UP12_9SPHI|nr:hypothetical protein EOD41_09470 [Mucilaginibacter limnophilus]
MKLTKYTLLQHELDVLKAYFDNIPGLTSNFYTDMLPRWDAINAKRKQLLTAEADTEHYLYLAIKGIQRCFTHTKTTRPLLFLVTQYHSPAW